MLDAEPSHSFTLVFHFDIFSVMLVVFAVVVLGIFAIMLVIFRFVRFNDIKELRWDSQVKRRRWKRLTTLPVACLLRFLHCFLYLLRRWR